MGIIGRIVLVVLFVSFVIGQGVQASGHIRKDAVQIIQSEQDHQFCVAGDVSSDYSAGRFVTFSTNSHNTSYEITGSFFFFQDDCDTLIAITSHPSGWAAGHTVCLWESSPSLPANCESDTTPPTISNLAATDLTATTAKIIWTTNEAASSQVEYGLTQSYGSQTAETDTNPRVTSHTVNLSGLACNTTYNYRAKSKDSSGNQGVSSNKTFATTACTGGSSSGGIGGGSGGSGSTGSGGTGGSGSSGTAGGTKTGTKTPGTPTGVEPAADGAVAVTSAPVIESIAQTFGEDSFITKAARVAAPIVVPVATIATATVIVPAVVSTVASSAAAAASGLSLQSGLLRFLQALSLSNFIRRKKPPWGEIVDTVTGAVLPGVLVELVDDQFGKVVDRTTTDKDGRFVMLVSRPGDYIFRIAARGFQSYVSPRPFRISNITYVPKSLRIALTPLHTSVSAGRLKRILIAQQIARGLSYTKIPLLVLGVAMTALAVVTELAAGAVTYLTIAIAALYAVLIANELRRFSLKRPYGKVLDRATTKPLELAIVRAFRQIQGRKQLASTIVTDSLGRFSLLVTPGVYTLDVIKLAYRPYQSSPKNLTGEHTLVNEKIELSPIHHG